MKKHRKTLRRLLSVSALTGFLMASTAFAASPGTLLSSEKNGDQLILYIQNPGEITEITGQIGTTPCDKVSYAAIQETETPIKTILLVDNSLSTTEVYRPMIREMMDRLISNSANDELFTIATFSEEISYLLQDSNDYEKLKQAIDSIEYAHQNTHLTDVLYELLTEWSNSDEGGYRRIVLFSDGLDNKTIGYTREELNELLKKHPYPIYTVGCAAANEESGPGLENMFSLSRMTSAAHWLFADISDPMEVVNEIAEGNDVICVALQAPEAVCDGTQKGVKVSIQTEAETMNVSTIMEMPFGLLQADADASKQGGFPIYIIIIIVAAAIAAGGIAVWRIRKRNEDELRFQTAPQGAAPQPENSNNEWNQWENTEPLTELASDIEDATAMIWSTNKLVLIDQKNMNRRFEVPLLQPVLIGRGRDTGCTIILDYDTSVSRRPHCQVRMNKEQVLAKDLGSSNGTYLNGHRLDCEAEIHDGDILKIGKVEMKVELH